MDPIKIDEASGIMYRCWRPFSSKAVLLLIHGLGAHSGRWEFLAEFFRKKEISSYAIELKGFGETKDLKGHIDSFDTYLDDARSLYHIIKMENPGKRVFVLGESMGSLISFLLAAREPELFAGLISISPVFKSRLKFSPLDYIRIFFSLLYNLKKQFRVPFDSKMCTQDASYQKTMEEEPREHRLATSRLLLEIAIAQMRCKFIKKNIKKPVLFLLAGKDAFTDIGISRRFFKGLAVKDKTIIEYPDMLHALSIELGKERVFEDVYGWILTRV